MKKVYNDKECLDALKKAKKGDIIVFEEYKPIYTKEDLMNNLKSMQKINEKLISINKLSFEIYKAMKESKLC